jgi:hypothetical protein
MKNGWFILGLTLVAVTFLAAVPANAIEQPAAGTATRDGALIDPKMENIDKAWGLWGERVGVSEFPFLKIGQGARAESMGGAFTAVADDINSAFWNPAGLGHIENVAYTLNYTRWFANSKLISGALAFNAGFGVIGLAVTSFAAEEFEVTTPTAPWGSGAMAQVGDISIGALFAKRMTDKFMLGGQIRWMQEDLYLEKVSNIDYSVGTHFYTGYRSTRIAMGFRNLGPNVKAREGGFTAQMPTTFSLAGAMEVFGQKGDPSYCTLSLEHEFITDFRPTTRVGGELWVQNTLALRGGYRTHMALESWSVGAGLKHELVGGKLITVDFSYHNEDLGLFDPPIRLSVGGTF